MQTILSRASPFPLLLRAALAPESDSYQYICGGNPVFTDAGKRCLLRLIRTHPQTMVADRITTREQALNIIQRLDSGESIAAVCRDGQIRVYLADQATPGMRHSILACLNIREITNVDFDTAYDAAYARKAMNPAQSCASRDSTITTQSEKSFKALTDVSQLHLLWRLFYTGEICVPTYVSDFVGAGDNPLATKDTARRFFEIVTETGLLFHNGQSGDKASRQKAYLLAYSYDQRLMLYMMNELNRVSGMFAFFVNANKWTQIPRTEAAQLNARIPVTYDSGDPQVSDMVLSGDAYSRLNTAGDSSLVFINEWLSPMMRDKMKQTRWYHITMVDTVFTRNILLSTVQDLSKKYVR